MKLRNPCEHGKYDEHTVTSHVIQDMEVGEIRLAGSCPGGVFLPDDTLLFDQLQDQLEDIYCIRLQNLGVHKRGLCQAFAGEAVDVVKAALSVREAE